MTVQGLRTLFLAALIGLAAAASAVVRPVAEAPRAAPDLETMLPERFGAWRRIEISQAVLPPEIDLAPGEAVAYRAYENDVGRVVTLVAAYGPPQGDSVRLHRPEACYVAQGFEIRDRRVSDFDANGGKVSIVNLAAQSPSRREAVSYWLRDGTNFTTRNSDSAWRRLRGNSAGPLDGALLRISTTSVDDQEFVLHRAFLSEFAAALAPEPRRLLLGSDGA